MARSPERAPGAPSGHRGASRGGSNAGACSGSTIGTSGSVSGWLERRSVLGEHQRDIGVLLVGRSVLPARKQDIRRGYERAIAWVPCNGSISTGTRTSAAYRSCNSWASSRGQPVASSARCWTAATWSTPARPAAETCVTACPAPDQEPARRGGGHRATRTHQSTLGPVDAEPRVDAEPCRRWPTTLSTLSP